MFTSFLFEPAFGVVDLERDTVHALGSCDNAVTLTTPEDIGRMTTAIVFVEPRIRIEVVHLAGDTITYRELADIVERAVNRPMAREAWTVPMLVAALADDPGNTLRKYHLVFVRGPGMAWTRTSPSMPGTAIP